MSHALTRILVAMMAWCAVLWSPVACTTHPRVVVLPYGAFGPQVLAYELIGYEWWQWQAHGDSRPREYAVHVVVYDHATQQEVARRYPVEPKNYRDYRYLTYDRAIRYLDTRIEEEKEDPGLVDELRATRERLRSAFERD